MTDGRAHAVGHVPLSKCGGPSYAHAAVTGSDSWASGPDAVRRTDPDGRQSPDRSGCGRRAAPQARSRRVPTIATAVPPCLRSARRADPHRLGLARTAVVTIRSLNCSRSGPTGPKVSPTATVPGHVGDTAGSLCVPPAAADRRAPTEKTATLPSKCPLRDLWVASPGAGVSGHEAGNRRARRRRGESIGSTAWCSVAPRQAWAASLQLGGGPVSSAANERGGK